MQKLFYTIDCSKRKIEDFISLLHSRQVNLLIDVRPNPMENSISSYNCNVLEQYLINEKISYKFMGRELGYLTKMKESRMTINYLNSISYLEAGLEFNYRIALMSADSDIQITIIEADLRKRGYEVMKLLSDENLKKNELEVSSFFISGDRNIS
ncbi:hypothetical protein ACFO4P_12955 [Epilithonimonas pallida]|uniref:DUF488 domain-containing protein n=1 Tax=Epilithonimonas pallida TaxID=373671 RepID=A0ABY1R547_9FLAO|nr:hypothetical protein [Epilithonimonas pallida]SMP95467.1 hypothetical protein SAMN05421679_107137 [Epilithonimonas pallida]